MIISDQMVESEIIADCVTGEKEVQCGFPADVSSSKIRLVHWRHCHSGVDVYSDGSHNWRYLCKLTSIYANRMGTGTDSTSMQASGEEPWHVGISESFI